MGETLLFLYALMLFMLIAAVIAVETHDLLSSVLCLGAVGFGLALVDLLVKAPDLALTQVVVEIFAVVLLIRTVVAREDTTEELLSDTPHMALVGGIILAIVVACFVCFRELEPLGKPMLSKAQQYQAYLRGELQEAPLEKFGKPPISMGEQYLRAWKKTGAANQVTAVLLDFRAYDTLGEATVIFAAIIGCYALLRARGRKEDEGNDSDS